MKRTFTLSLIALLTGCTTVHDVTAAVRADDPRWQSIDGCRVVDVVAEDTPLTFDATTTYEGSWVDLDHPADEAWRFHVDVVDVPSTWQEGDSANGVLATTGHPGDGHTSTHGSLDGLSGSRTAPLTPAEGGPVYGSTSSVFLAPTGWTFRVRLCPDTRAPFPTCHLDGMQCEWASAFEREVDGAYACACTPGCATDADCPIADTGDAASRCTSGRCVLACDGSTTCPDGQRCTDTAGALGVGTICMTPP